MALSQLQCLDENHVNPRTHESKPEFLYCEDQRLALEALLRDGREAFFKYLEAHGLRGFLSDPELETLTGTAEPFDPDTEIVPENAEEDEPPLSLQYWPYLSDTSVPQMDLGWPDSEAYRGVTRATIHSQPPLDGQAHIKEIVRRTIAQAQKVIAVVMDVFTDVDIFRDLLDAGFRRRVSVYILLERTTLPHFLSMCQRANMHAGHLKHLRVRHTEGVEFYTRSSTKVRGRMGHRFMLIDGDKAVSGSYSFTWMSSRMDRNVITVVTGQVVDTFDRLFHTLYVTSRLVDLRQFATEPEPEPEPLPQPVVVPPPSAALARKLYSPKYALALGNPSFSPSPTPSAFHNSPKNAESQENTEVPDTKKRKHKRAIKEAIQEGPPIHPGLINLEKAYLIPYLPTWPEPDPSSDVIGFINIRDPSKSTQVHLQRSEMFETSQAIRFSTPINMPEETLPEVAMPRKVTTQHEETNKLLPTQYKTKVEGSVVDRVQPTQLKTQPGDIRSKAQGPDQNSPASQLKCESNRGTARTLSADNGLHSHLDLDAGRCTTPLPNAPALLHSSNKASTPKTGSPSHTTQAVSTNNPELNPKEETGLNTQTGVMSGTHTSHCSDLNTGQQIKTVLPGIDSHTKPQNISEVNHNIQIPCVKSNLFPASTSPMCSQSAFCENNHVSIITNVTTTVPLSPINSTLTSSSTLSPPVPSSPPSLPLTTPPIAKPRTIQIVIKDGTASDGQKHMQFSVIRGHKPSTRPLVACNEPVVKGKMPDKERETVSELQSNNGSKKGAQKDADNRGNIGDAPQVKHSETSKEAKNEETIGPKDDRTGMDLLAGTNPGTLSDFLLTDAPEVESVNSQKIIPKDVEPTILSTDSKLTPHIAGIAKLQTWTNDTERDLTGCEFAEVPNEKNVTRHKTYLPSEPHRMSCCAMRSSDMNVLDTSKAPTHIPLLATHKPNMSKDVLGHKSPTDTHGQQSNLVNCTDSLPNTAKHNTYTTIQEQTPKARQNTHTPEKPLCLHIFDTHVPDIRSATPERELLVRTPNPDGFLPHLPTPDSQIRTPEPLSYTPDLRTATSDVSDGYISPRTDSTLSTTSGEYYECSDSPFTESVVFQAAYHSHLMTEDHVSSNTPNAVTTPTTPTYINHASISSSHEKKLKIGEEEKSDNEESGSEVEEKEKKVAERRAERESWGPQRRGSDEAKTTADHLKQNKHLTDSGDKNEETQAQDPKRKRMLHQPAADRSVDGRATPDELTNQEAEAKQLSTGVLKPSEAPAEGEGLDKDKASGPSALESRDRRLSSTETEGQKLLHTPLRSLQGNQNGGVSPPSRPPRPSRPLSGVRPHGSRQQNQAESKALHGSSQVLDKISSPCRVPIKPPPPVTGGDVGSAAGRKHAEASNSQPSHQPRPHPVAQSRMKTGQSTNQRPDPQLHPHVNNQMGSAQVVPCQEDGKTPISFSFSKQHSRKALKDKMSKLPVRSKRDSSSSPVQRHKSDS